MTIWLWELRERWRSWEWLNCGFGIDGYAGNKGAVMGLRMAVFRIMYVVGIAEWV